MSRKKVHRVKVSKPKTRKTWTRHPGEKVVNNKREKRPTGKELGKDALDEYEDTE